MNNLNCSTIWGFHCYVLCSVICDKYLVTFCAPFLSSGTDCTQAGLVLAAFYSEAMLLELVQNEAHHYLAERCRDVPEKDGWKHMLLHNLNVPLSINGAPTDVTVTHDAVGNNSPAAFELCLDNSLFL